MDNQKNNQQNQQQNQQQRSQNQNQGQQPKVVMANPNIRTQGASVPPPKTVIVNNSSSPVMQIVAAFIVGILVGVIGYSIANRHPNDAMVVSTASSTTPYVGGDYTDQSTQTSSGTATSSMLSVSNQSAGKSVAVSGLNLTAPAWVVIQDNVNGHPGSILGAAYFPAGQDQSGTVSLLRATVAGTSYVAVLHFDNGATPHAFNYRNDAIMDDGTGHPIATSFTAQ